MISPSSCVIHLNLGLYLPILEIKKCLWPHGIRPSKPPKIIPMAAPISPYVTNHQTMYGNPHASATAPSTGSLLNPCCMNIAANGILNPKVAIGALIFGIILLIQSASHTHVSFGLANVLYHLFLMGDLHYNISHLLIFPIHVFAKHNHFYSQI